MEEVLVELFLILFTVGVSKYLEIFQVALDNTFIFLLEIVFAFRLP